MKLFLGSPIFQVPAPYSTTYSGYAWVRSKITTSCCVVFGSVVCRLRIDELPQDFACAPMRFTFSHLHLLKHSLSHDRLGMPWKPFWIPVDDSFKRAYVEDWVFQITDPSDISLPGGHGRILFLRLPRCRCLFPRHKGKHRNPRFQLVLRNVR